jgi:hypothetical protein
MVHTVRFGLKTFFGLSFLDPGEVEECFVFDIFSEVPESEKAIKFADYVVNNYIDKSSTFLQITRADSDVECKRTTNGCESFHKYSIRFVLAWKEE